MKLVFIYGPPAVGKLTVANALAKLTGFRVFHNHLTLEVVLSIFEWGQGPFWELVNRYRLDLLEAAAQAAIPGVIFTFVYAKGHDDDFVHRVVERIQHNGGEVYFVRLECAKKELFRRLRASSRRTFHKMRRAKDLKDLIHQHELFKDVPHANNLVIDNTRLSAKKTAEKIANHFGLP
jgi:shikimate kinase